MQVGAGERGLVRVFAIDAAPEKAAAWLDTESADWPLPRALGVAALDPGAVQVVRVRELGEIGLSGLLEAGHGVDEAQLEGRRETLDAETGLVAVIRSTAFAGPAELRPAPPLRLLGVFAEPSAPVSVGEVGDYASARPGQGDRAETARDAAEPDDASAAREVFRPDRDRYVRDHLWLAAIGMVGATAVLWLLGDEWYWIGAVAALLAVGVRGWYLASEELARSWELTPAAVRAVSPEGAHQRSVSLAEVARVRRLGSAVQVVTTGGEKMLLKYMADPERVRGRIAAAAGVE
jgi:hypothetical protein